MPPDAITRYAAMSVGESVYLQKSGERIQY